MSRIVLGILVILMVMILPLTVARCQLTNQSAYTAVDPCPDSLLSELLTQGQQFGQTAVALPVALLLPLLVGCYDGLRQKTAVPDLFAPLPTLPPPRLV